VIQGALLGMDEDEIPLELYIDIDMYICVSEKYLPLQLSVFFE
jgi:hypothetical protein